jgi:hypothetical protein
MAKRPSTMPLREWSHLFNPHCPSEHTLQQRLFNQGLPRNFCRQALRSQRHTEKRLTRGTSLRDEFPAGGNLIGDANESHANKIKLRSSLHLLSSFLRLLFRGKKLREVNELSVPPFIHNPSSVRFLSHAIFIARTIAKLCRQNTLSPTFLVRIHVKQ